MFIITKKLEDGRFNIFDTDDNSNDTCSIADIREYCRLNIPIRGVTVEDGKIKIAPQSKQQGFTSTARRTVKSNLATGNDLSVFDVEQRKVIEDYYVWATVSLYKTLAQSLRLNIRESKIAELTSLRGTANWEFGGIRDTGVMGGGVCALGHALRYEYYAVGEEGRNRQTLVFGETCAGDFLDISQDDMKKLVKVRKTMSDEIGSIIEIKESGTEEHEWKELELLNKVLMRLETVGYNQLLEPVFSKNFLKFLRKFKEVNIPYPESLVKALKKQLVAKGYYWTVSSLFQKQAEYIPLLKRDDIEMEGGTAYQYRRKFSSPEDLEVPVATYVWFMMTNKIEGKFAYDPIEEVCKSEGGFSKKAKAERKGILEYINRYLGCREFTFEELEKLIQVYGLFEKCNQLLISYASLVKLNPRVFDVAFDDVKNSSIYDFTIHACLCFKGTFSKERVINGFALGTGFFKKEGTRPFFTITELHEKLKRFSYNEFNNRLTVIATEHLKKQEELASTDENDLPDPEGSVELSNYLEAKGVKKMFSTLADAIERDKALCVELDKASTIIRGVVSSVAKYGKMSHKQYNTVKWGYKIYTKYSEEEFCSKTLKEEEEDNEKRKSEHKAQTRQVDGRAPEIVEPFIEKDNMRESTRYDNTAEEAPSVVEPFIPVSSNGKPSNFKDKDFIF